MSMLVTESLHQTELLDTLARAVEANRQTSHRRGNVIYLSPDDADDVVVSADLHGHRENFAAILELADLENHPRRHLVLQEVCHGGPTYETAHDIKGCQSHEMLAEVAGLKVAYPERVHFILSNHELSEWTGHPIHKDGCMLSIVFLLGIHQLYGDDAEAVHAAYMQFVASCPLAVRIGSDVLVTHSAPAEADRQGFDATVFDRPYEKSDLEKDGSIFRLVWGRDYRPENARAFAESVNARVLVHGHTPCPQGFHVPNPWQLILDCCATPATCAVIPVRDSMTLDEVVQTVHTLPSGDISHDENVPGNPDHWRYSVTGINDSLQEAMKIEGALAAAIVDATSGMCLGTAGGAQIDLEVAAAGDTEVWRAKRRSLESIGLSSDVEEIIVTTAEQLHILKALDSDPNLFFYLVLKRSGCNLALAKHRLGTIDRELTL